MLGGCIFSAKYVYRADIYRKNRIVKPSGQISFTLNFEKTINCAVKTFVSTSFKAASTNEHFSDLYENLDWIQILTKDEIEKDVQITNIRKSDTSEIIFKEIELLNSPATWFNSNGSNLSIDPFGRVFEYTTLLKRADEQGNV